MTSGIATLHLKDALTKPGCPICRVRRESEAHYIFYLLYENVNDLNTRGHLIASQGLCPAHTWQTLRREESGFGDSLGNSIIYADLCQRAAQGLEHYLKHSNDGMPIDPSNWRARLRGLLERFTMSDGKMEPLTPREACRVCEMGESTARSNLSWLIEGCTDTDPVFRTAYEASSGLCLAHLRQALSHSELSLAGGVRFIAATNARKLAALTHDLEEYGRKHAWDNRHEKLTEAEAASVERAASFFGGLSPDAKVKMR
jgi:hypothetical protein